MKNFENFLEYWTKPGFETRDSITDKEKELFSRDLEQSKVLANIFCKAIESGEEQDWLLIFKNSMKSKGYFRKLGIPSKVLYNGETKEDLLSS